MFYGGPVFSIWLANSWLTYRAETQVCPTLGFRPLTYAMMPSAKLPARRARANAVTRAGETASHLRGAPRPLAGVYLLDGSLCVSRNNAASSMPRIAAAPVITAARHGFPDGPGFSGASF